ncbi:unnamed protein product [Polarella glacialis]|uniref:Uncharacterized protein n=1 Tax=Polarella glacialis TaxID=89957 RepID=A0A813HCS0_POLGL|nr:unnamed protein product [Polarella glacialis]
MERLAVIGRHVVISSSAVNGRELAGESGKTMPKLEVLQAFVQDPAWAGQPVWMLNVLKFKSGADGEAKYREYGKLMRTDGLPKAGGRLVFSAYARTVIGRKAFDMVAIAEYPSPQAFLQMAMSQEQAAKNQVRLQGLEEQYLIPMRPGWFNIDRPAPKPSRAFTQLTAANVWNTPNGMVGLAAEGARVGETSASREQAEAFVEDQRLAGGDRALWHLNLLQFSASGEETYGKYAKNMGGKDGVLSQFGARSTLAADCYRSLIGEFDFHRAIIVEYPCRDSFLSMGASDSYLKTAHFRHQGLSETYIVSCAPDIIDVTAPAAHSASASAIDAKVKLGQDMVLPMPSLGPSVLPGKMRLYHTHVLDDRRDQERLPLEEMQRQMRVMERRVTSLAAKNNQSKGTCKSDIQRKANENATLVHELNELRVQKRSLNLQAES